MEQEQDTQAIPANGKGKYQVIRRSLGKIGRRLSINPQKTDASLTAVTGIILRILALLHYLAREDEKDWNVSFFAYWPCCCLFFRF